MKVNFYHHFRYGLLLSLVVNKLLVFASSSSTNNKILCLYGEGQTKEEFEDFSISDLHYSLPEYEFVTVPNSNIIDDNWNTIIDDNNNKNNEGSSSNNKNAIERLIENLNFIIETKGPFVGILGFAEGAAFIPYYLSSSNNVINSFEFIVSFCGYLLNSNSNNIHNKTITIPSLIWMGQNDTIVPNVATYDMITTYYSESSELVIIESENGIHSLPTSCDPTFEQVVTFMRNKFDDTNDNMPSLSPTSVTTIMTDSPATDNPTINPSTILPVTVSPVTAPPVTTPPVTVSPTTIGPTKIVSENYCGNGNINNGMCENSNLCCSDWGWCGTSQYHCKEKTLWPTTSSTSLFPTTSPTTSQTPSVTIQPTQIPSSSQLPTITETPTMNVTDPDVPPFGCFPGSAIVEVLVDHHHHHHSQQEVTTKTTKYVPLSSIRIGEHVRVSDARFEEVYAFGHYDSNIQMEYLKVYYYDNNDNPSSPSSSFLELSYHHLIFVIDNDDNNNIKTIPASHLRVGDQLLYHFDHSNNNSIESNTKIVSIRAIEGGHNNNNNIRKGAYAPFTSSGTIVVNNIQTSTYISLQNSEYFYIGNNRMMINTGMTHQFLLHTFMTLYHHCCIGSIKGKGGGLDNINTIDGITSSLYIPYRIFLWWDNLSITTSTSNTTAITLFTVLLQIVLSIPVLVSLFVLGNFLYILNNIMLLLPVLFFTTVVIVVIGGMEKLSIRVSSKSKVNKQNS